MTLALKLIFGLSLVWLLLARMDREALGASFGRFGVLSVAIAVAMTFAGTAIAAMRWKLLLPEVPLPRLLRYTLIGQFYSIVLPGQVAGEAVKAWKISRGAFDRPRLVASVMIDRLVGLIGLMLVSVVGISLTSRVFAKSLVYPIAATTALLVACMFLLSLPSIQRLAIGAIEYVARRVPALGRGMSEKAVRFVRAWRDLANIRSRLAASLCLGVAFQLLGVAIYVVLAMDIGVAISPFDWMWMAGVAAIVVLLPLSVGGIGLREGALVVMLAQFGVPGESALALSLAAFGLTVLPALVGGIADMTDPSDSKGSAPSS